MNVARIAARTDGFEGGGAAALGAALAQVTGAELLLAAVHPEPEVLHDAACSVVIVPCPSA